MKYLWKRFWSPPDGQINLTDNGFLYDPTDSFGKYVNPNLITIDFTNNKNCLILLGEPGIGKSIELEGIYESLVEKHGGENVLLLDLRDFMTQNDFVQELESSKSYQDWIEEEKPFYLFLDSFDEVSFSFPRLARAFIRLLKKNSNDKRKNLFLRLSCRTAVLPAYLEDGLMNLWEKEQIQKYELCSLTKADVTIALEQNNINSNEFLTEVYSKGITGFAANPLTLNFLIDLFQQKGSLPNKKADIYAQGCNLLLREPDPSSDTKPKLSLMERNAIAERIAMATFLGAKPIIIIDSSKTVGKGELHITELLGKEILKDSSFFVSEENISEVINTGLFSSRGDGKMGWAHQTFGEFLAAQYLLRHKLEWAQLRSLLFQDPLKIGLFQVVPQLYEVAAWVASLDSTFFEKAVLLDPEFLMLSDTNVISDSQKRQLVEQLLIKLDKGELFDRHETFHDTNYKKLFHPDLATQLKPFIIDKSKGIVVRRAAIEIAKACAISSLEEELVTIALDSNDNLSIRVRATKAIAKIGKEQTKKRLKKVITSEFQEDPEDELKGAVLQVLWPKYLSINDLFLLLAPPKRHNLVGAYIGFLRKLLEEADFSPEEILQGLNWVKNNAIRTESIEGVSTNANNGMNLQQQYL